jgi:LCP family protein required for cell wall assembly
MSLPAIVVGEPIPYGVAHFTSRAPEPDVVEAPAVSKPKRRWVKRMMLGMSILLVAVLALAGGAWYYVNEQLSNIAHFKTKVKGLRVALPPSAPMDILLVGSDTRAFAVGNSGLQQHFGNAAVQTGQRSDVIIVLRLDPVNDTAEMLSIPRDTWVPIYGTGGDQRINTAYNSGPSQLVETLKADFGIPIDHVIQANFIGFTNIVNALSGIYLNFPVPVKDKVTGLNVTKTGCQLTNGTTALELVRSRDLSYYENGQWIYDGMADWSRIRRQQAFFHSVITRAHHEVTDIGSMLPFVHAVAADLTVDKGVTSSLLESLGWHYRHVDASALSTLVLPTVGTYINGAAVLLPAVPQAVQVVRQFLSFGISPPKPPTGSTTSTSTSTSTTTTTTLVPTTTSPPSQVVTDNQPEPWNPFPCYP